MDLFYKTFGQITVGLPTFDYQCCVCFLCHHDYSHFALGSYTPTSKEALTSVGAPENL